ncbi:hypothetical protein J4Q44_G00133760 [Coregonus suidteri]|uniref:Rab11 family-interacting protein 1-like n=1 Tax=Coregonus suidteri TaxID=861788 RepID=A0AAN8LYE8_9TELE
MSLSDQSQQWYPTSVQVTVLQARSLRIKGKNGTNDAYAIMQVAKDKFATSVVEKSVAPVWKEEATFELPLFHNGNAEKCTLHVHVMHRALVGPDKLLGHAVINLLELSEVKSRNKTEWHKLLDKAGKPDKDRGEVLVDIQFMKNNLTASMFDLSATDKPRSRLGKFKDKVRGKKKEGLSDSASAVVPSFTQVLTDSEGEGEGGADKGEKKKKNNLKSLFSPKSNLQRHGLSQSMSVLGPLPEKNSSLSGSRSSGLNVDSSEGKNKFKFLTHKRTGSSDSKASQGSLSLGRSKVPAPLAEQSNLCINGSHVYTEEPQSRSARTGSTFSLASSGRGSMEDLRRAQGRKSSSTSMDSLMALKQPSPWAEEEEEEEEERFKMDEEMKRKEEQERKKLEEEEGMRKEEQEKRRIGEEEERLRFEEERIRIEEEKMRPSSWGNPSKPVISSNPFLSSSSPELESSMDSPRGDGETRDAIDPSTELMEKKVPTPLAPNKQRWARKDNWSSKAKSHCATPKLTKTKPTKPPPPLRRHSSTSLVGSWDDQGSVSGKDHSSVRQDKGPAPLPPDNQRWARKDNWPSKSNPDSANSILTQIKPTKPHPPPRRNSATSMVGSEHDQHLNESVSQDDSSVRRDKRPAPLPPDRPNQAPSETQRDQSMTSVNQGHKDRVGASMSKVSQRVVQMITPLTSSSTATTEHISGGQSSSHHGNQAGESMPSAIGGLIVAKHNKGPAPSRPQHLPGKTMPKADVLDEQSNTDEHESSVEFEFDPNNPFAEDCRMEKSSGRGEEQSLTGERQESLDSHNQQSCTSTDADLGLFQKSVVGDTTELPTPDVLPAEDGSCPNKSTSAKRVRAPLPPVKKTSTFREEGTGKQSSGKLQSPGAPTSSKLSSDISVKTQSGGVGVALPCVTVAQPPCVPSPAPSSLPHPEPLKGSGGRRDCPPQTTSSVPGQKTLLHAGALPSIAEQCSGEEAGGSGDRPASSTRRPHPVKPLRSLENQPASDIQEGQAGKSTRILGGLQEKMKGKDTGVKGPYSQLTQEELISLVVKQQEQLSKRDDKIKELEQYIDNLLVRIIEEQPSILMSMNSLK